MIGKIERPVLGRKIRDSMEQLNYIGSHPVPSRYCASFPCRTFVQPTPARTGRISGSSPAAQFAFQPPPRPSRVAHDRFLGHVQHRRHLLDTKTAEEAEFDHP